MATNHDVWDAVVQTDGTPAQSFEFLLSLFYGSPATAHRTADVADVNPAFSAKTRARNTYAAKGVDNAIKYGSNLVLSWNHEAIRDQNGEFQADLVALLKASRANGTANLMRIQAYDALGADYAFDGLFAIDVSRQNTGWDDSGWFAITATQNKFNGWITNPVKTGNVPLISAVSPSGAATGSTIYVQGSNFIGVTTGNVKIGATAATSINVLNDGLLSCTVPSGSAGATTVTVTNTAGDSAAFPYTRAA